MKSSFNIYFLFITVFVLLLSNKLNSQTTVSGKVISNKKLPLGSVIVLIKDSYDGATSNKDGSYSFVAADTGTFILHAALVGYIDFDQEIHLTGKELKDCPWFGKVILAATVGGLPFTVPSMPRELFCCGSEGVALMIEPEKVPISNRKKITHIVSLHVFFI